MEKIIALLLGTSILFLVLGIMFFINRNNIRIYERLETYTKDSEYFAIQAELDLPFKQRVILPLWESIVNRYAKLIPTSKREAYEKKLIAAGNPMGMTLDGFLILRYIVLLVCFLIGILTKNLVFLLFFIALGFVLPDLYLKSHSDRRRETMLKSLPDILDLLGVSVEAGLGFDAALQKVIEKTKGPLPKEFEIALQEIAIGKPRRDALRDMAARTNIDEVTTFIGTVIQADQLGVSITNVLKSQSKQVRLNRKMKAEEQAQKAPVKILIPMVLFIFPTILIVLLGPAVIQLVDALN